MNPSVIVYPRLPVRFDLARRLKTVLFGWLVVMVAAAPLTGVYGWSANGHATIAKAAFAELTPAQQRFYAELLTDNRISTTRSRTAVHLGNLAKWPDQVRSLTVQQLFTQYGSGKVPRALAAWSGRTTKEWHYENAVLVDGLGRLVDALPARDKPAKSCPPARNGKMLAIWPQLLAAWEQSRDRHDRVLLISFLLHFSGDAHQPLHSMAALRPGCKHDGGGNGFCVGPGAARFTERGQRCQNTLHRAWDGGFGVLNKSFAPTPWKASLKVADLESVLEDHRGWAGEIYPNAERPFESEQYQARSREIIKTTASRAVAYQALLLRELARRQGLATIR